ncbi:DUF2922 domain-containing protein [Enterococcus sp. CSURQ0835]|uniref:DUF2922 domain-containing protein n=1 Tax=Enterococcus sp. CSURQ0835 TaxID=2681394 RepID=UPI001356B636|nr:DUF2922 domain-containing protein [Enterococcus sp. CSURQ0835]
MLKLVVDFKNQAGDKTRISFSDAKAGMTGSEVKAEMEKVVTAQMFVKDELNMYEAVHSGKYVETIETSLF